MRETKTKKSRANGWEIIDLFGPAKMDRSTKYATPEAALEAVGRAMDAATQASGERTRRVWYFKLARIGVHVRQYNGEQLLYRGERCSVSLIPQWY